MNKPALLSSLLPAPAAQSPTLPVIAIMLRGAADRRVLTRSVEHICIEPGAQNVDGADFDLAIIDLHTLLRFENEIRELRAKAAPALRPFLLAASESELLRANSFLGDLAEDVIRTPIRRVELTARINNLLRLRQASRAQQRATENTQWQLRGANRALKAFSVCNERVIHASSEKEVLNEICKSLEEEGGYALAWVAQAKGNDSGRVKPLAVSGKGGECIYELERGGGDDVLAQGPVVTTLKTGKRQLLSGLASEPKLSGWKTVVAAHQLHSVLVFPLLIRGKEPEACLAIYSVDTDAFDPSEIDLLQRMVDNVIHGIRALREKSRRRRSEKKAHQMAYRDGLTGLANRTAAIEALDRHLRQAGPFPPAAGLLYLDLDGFKLVNDVLGHRAGDEVLVQVAERLKAAVRDSDLVARQGGDEFIIFAPHESDHGLSTIESGELINVMSRVAERVLQAFEKPFLVYDREHYLGASIGISLCPGHSCDAATLMMRADSAMYQAKRIVGNSYRFFSSELSQRQQHRLSIENKLYRAVEEDQFTLVYQPLVDLASTRTIGVEALIRWPQADGSIISPSEFIPIAEETGLIIRIGDWVMTEALTALQRWRAAGFTDLKMAVNLAIGQLWQPRLVESIRALLDSRNVPPGALTVELTEGSLMSDVHRMEGVVREFRQAGIDVAIDDFGTGYSSLARLRSLPITTLKIDRTFLFDTPDDQSAVMMVNTIRQMAECLGIHALAEGIETAGQWRMLQALGCSYGQGFYFARPMTESDLIKRLTTEGWQIGVKAIGST